MFLVDEVVKRRLGNSGLESVTITLFLPVHFSNSSAPITGNGRVV